MEEIKIESGENLDRKINELINDYKKTEYNDETRLPGNGEEQIKLIALKLTIINALRMQFGNDNPEALKKIAEKYLIESGLWPSEIESENL